MIAVADAGLGNIASVANMLDYLAFEAVVMQEPGDLRGVSHVILPGVGSFDEGMDSLERTGWGQALIDHQRDVKILGVCLGMQLLSRSSDEGSKAGLGLIPADFVRIDSTRVAVPHMGWNEVRVVRTSALFPEPIAHERFYFTHSYRAQCSDPEVVLALTEHGEEIVAAYGAGNVYGVQFHPEKSHVFGMSLLRRFASI